MFANMKELENKNISFREAVERWSEENSSQKLMSNDTKTLISIDESTDTFSNTSLLEEKDVGYIFSDKVEYMFEGELIVKHEEICPNYPLKNEKKRIRSPTVIDVPEEAEKETLVLNGTRFQENMDNRSYEKVNSKVLNSQKATEVSSLQSTRRGRGRGVSNLSAWMTKQQKLPAESMRTTSSTVPSTSAVLALSSRDHKSDSRESPLR